MSSESSERNKEKLAALVKGVSEGLNRNVKPGLEKIGKAGQEQAKVALDKVKVLSDKLRKSSSGSGETPTPSEPTRPAEAPVRTPSVPAVAWLIVYGGEETERRYDLVEGENRIGRSESCTATILGDGDISRQHALVRVKGTECRLCDLGSRNGTYLNDQLIDRDRVLQEGDIVTLGRTRLLFKRP